MTQSTREDRTLQVAEQVVQALAQEGAPAVLVGALALAIHGYPRNTRDLDLATYTDPFSTLRRVVEKLQRVGLSVELSLPDADDPLGGVATISGPDFNDVQVVNFCNPLSRGGLNPGAAAVRMATQIVEGTSLKVVDLPHLIALKLYGGGPKARTDVLELLARNPQADRDQIRHVCEKFGLAETFEKLRREVED